ncbi:AAA family ATPase [Candidatus Roizmanbacteria bacterium RIFCSPHIGHO2_02_FULL_40_13b]|uniref:AAA family ATPase n=1 Tax=Candidatus Roizmanbacteria bacterium RIFCSPHIGHO2_01_FULL_39_24 TaxID=1802032 RepID=A0A1F7GIN5_9BACT|nr:MAG: AAA family ATPase [Candidatus Roizmanbacteria bacterium RIFCSPHIGHO2_01_FULL_39_24]OGK27159.1 MAG: AAA family ATPase [Candidatus Roizmanbacteria bacterium RIFCSPHIGHO2_02_FULL_40_13b]OGK49447.1 MAG: AAA family ATPase [Candidatus Roizmanbacteria bacterium RIFCSPLOWO2_01_FULL_40_32]OGK57360.1 MAG: AAA family ATPase [Candidatus Roizmanbacteria bacterium RIFCSPLOWO2_02_FULL_39_8]
MKIKRLLEDEILAQLESSTKGIVIYGPRQAGKTTLVNDILTKRKWKTLILNGDRRGNWWETITSRELSKIKLLLSGYQTLFIDEAQRIPEIGLSLKIILDEFPDLKVIVTGSSSLDLASKISEPLTGRIITHKLYPISFVELNTIFTPFELLENLEERMIFGSYPEIFSLHGILAKTEYLMNLTDTYLYKDLLEFGGIRNSNKIRDLLKLLAFQIGSQVSLSELGNSLDLSRTTVDRYIDLLEKSFIVFRLSGFSRNLRKEVSKMDKIYFYDIGVRNTIIGNLNFLNNRDDQGKLWENFLMIERIKRQQYAHTLYGCYYWRLSSGAEIDLVEEEGGQLSGFEFKYTKKTIRSPKSWLETYSNSTFHTINKDNFLDFVTI